MHFILKGMPLKNPSMKKDEDQVIWNTNKPGGWTKYKDLTDNNNELDVIREKAENMTSNEMMKKIENVTTKIKYKCFGKVNNSRRMESDKDLDKLYNEKAVAASNDEIKAVEEKIAEQLLVKQREEYENKLEYLQ